MEANVYDVAILEPHPAVAGRPASGSGQPATELDGYRIK